ncbi:MAG TPA: nitroreductase [Solirubrobacter sp.]|nr:nitroreductase [Solirubrobacter sp.]
MNATALDELIRTRRTHKAFGPDPVPPAVLLELFELARWAPNHHVTDPWRFRVLGDGARERLKAAADELKPGSGAKLDRAPTLIAVSAKQDGDAAQDHEDVLATAVAAYIVLLGAHARGLAGYWRTVPVMEAPAGRAALGIPEDELPIGLLHLGTARQEQRVPDRAPVDDIAVFLD